MPTFEEAQAYELENEWIWYGHHPSGSTTYNKAYIELGRFNTVAGFWQFYNAFPPITSVHDGTLMLNGHSVVAYSLFRTGVLPEWEDPVNHNGSEWGCRESLDRSRFGLFWDTYILAAIGEQIPHCVGVRAINKCNRTRRLHKVEVWLNKHDPETVETTHEVLLSLLPMAAPKFTLLLHNVKQSQALEYQRRRQSMSPQRLTQNSRRQKTRSGERSRRA